MIKKLLQTFFPPNNLNNGIVYLVVEETNENRLLLLA